MSSIHETAYPRFKPELTQRELEDTYIGKGVYKLSSDQKLVRVFLSSLVAPKRSGAAGRRKHLALPDQSMAGRHFHIFADDINYAIRVNQEPVQRDPLVAALFGSAKHRVQVGGRLTKGKSK